MYTKFVQIAKKIRIIVHGLNVSVVFIKVLLLYRTLARSLYKDLSHSVMRILKEAGGNG